MGIMITGLLAYAIGSFVLNAAVYAPALSFGGPGAVYLTEKAGAGPMPISSPSEPLLCFDAIVWHRLCSGFTFTKLTPANVSDRNAGPVDIEPHMISTPQEAGPLPPHKCRTTKIPAGLAPGVWRLSGHATNTCNMWIGSVEVTSLLPDVPVTIKAP